MSIEDVPSSAMDGGLAALALPHRRGEGMKAGASVEDAAESH